MSPKQGQGWVKIHRSLCDSSAWKCSLIERLVWLWLLLHVRYEDTPEETHDGVIVQRGEFYGTNSFIAHGISWYEGNGAHVPGTSSINRALKSLQASNRIEFIKTPRGAKWTHIRVLNWDLYQGGQQQNQLFESREDRGKRPDPIAGRSREELKKERSKEEKNTERGDVACASAREDTPPRVDEPKEAIPPKPSRVKAPTKQAMHTQAMAAYKAGAFPLPEHLDKPEVREAFEEWLISRESMRCWLTENAIKRTVAKLGPFSPEEAVHLLNQSADNNWKGVVFPNTPPPGQVLTAKPVNGSGRVNGAKPRNERLYPQTTHEKNNPDWAKAYRKPQIVIKANGDREVRNG